MDPEIAVVPENSLEGFFQQIMQAISCMSFGRCMHPM